MSDAPLSPVRARMLHALQRRAAAQPAAVAQLLAQRLPTLTPDACPQAVAAVPTAAPARSVAWPRVANPAAPLASVLRFQKVWARHRTLERMARAGAQRPANAGPLNSHGLALQTLQRLQQLPSGYLHRFVAQLEALLWLEAVAAESVAATTASRKPAQAARTRPARKRRE